MGSNEPPRDETDRMKTEASQQQQQQQQQQSELARRAARGTLATLLLRVASFACTQAAFRIADPSVLGRAMVQLDLLLTTVLFVSREGFRLALTRNLSRGPGTTPADEEAAYWNVAWCTVPSVTAAAAIALGWHVRRNIHADRDYYVAGILYCLACCIEGWAEPAVLCSLRRLNVTVKASAEGLATLVKTFTTVFLLRYLLLRDDSTKAADWSVTAFGVAQVAYSIVYAAVLYSATWSDLKRPHWTKGTWKLSSVERSALYLVLVFTLQGLFKHLLTEGDRIVLTTLSGTYDQGVYAMGSAYGGLAARLLLQPVEENARLLWSRLAVPNMGASQRRSLQESYTALVKIVLYIGFIFSFLAVNYTSVLLNLLAGRKWGSNPEAVRVLSAFCVYTAFLAWNGTTEAFVYAVAGSGKDLGRLGMAHTIIACIFAAVASAAVTRYGTVGLVAANCVAMLFRSGYSITFAARYFAGSRGEDKAGNDAWLSAQTLLTNMIPHPMVMVSFVASFAATHWSQQRMESESAFLGVSSVWVALAAQHVSVGAACAAGLVAMAYATEKEFLRSFRTMLSDTPNPKQD
jgi:oligosaccharide translocation protein RFT1